MPFAEIYLPLGYDLQADTASLLRSLFTHQGHISHGLKDLRLQFDWTLQNQFSWNPHHILPSVRKLTVEIKSEAEQQGERQFQQFLSCLPNVVDLTISATTPRIPLEFTVAPGFRWNFLKRLHILTCDFHSKQMLHLLRLHSSTLEEVRFEDFDLIGLRWASLMARVFHETDAHRSCIVGSWYHAGIFDSLYSMESWDLESDVARDHNIASLVEKYWIAVESGRLSLTEANGWSYMDWPFTIRDAFSPGSPYSRSTFNDLFED